jgi:hypothetical protein
LSTKPSLASCVKKLWKPGFWTDWGHCLVSKSCENQIWTRFLLTFFVRNETNIFYKKQYSSFSSLFIWQIFFLCAQKCIQALFFDAAIAISYLPNPYRMCSIFRPFLEDRPTSRLQLEHRPMSGLVLEGRPMSRLHFEDWPMNGLHLADRPMRSLLAERRGHLDWDRSGLGNGHGMITTISLSTLHIGESNYLFVHGLIHSSAIDRKCWTSLWEEENVMI